MIPISDSPHSRTFPYVNVAIVAVNFAVFFYELMLSQHAASGVIGNFRITSQLDRFILHWGNVPACSFDALGWARHLGGVQARECASQPQPALTALSAMFMHGGWLHILGNMLFLWIFGDNVEDALGHVRYAVFYVVVGSLAALTHGLVNANDLTPAIGASGAIAGVMGAYIVLYPRATVSALFFIIPLRIPAFIMIGIWFATQLFSGFSSLGVDAVGASGGVAYFAHIGGFIAGAALVTVFTIGRPRRTRPRYAR